ncbi:MAG: TolC family protein [Candidatus Eisenbacteria bacterium]
MSALFRPSAGLVLIVSLAFAAPLSGSDAVPARAPLALEDAVRMALENSRRLEVARTAEASAAEEVRGARAAFFPVISFEAGYVRLDEAPYISGNSFLPLLEGLRRPFESLARDGLLPLSELQGLTVGPGHVVVGDEDNYSAGFRLRQPLFTGFALRGAHESAVRRREAEGWGLRREEECVRFDVTAAYFDLAKAVALEGTAESAVAMFEGHVRDREALRGSGVILEADLLRARVELSKAKLDLSRARSGIRLATVRLAYEIGSPLGPVAPSDTLGPREPVEEDLEDLTGRALERRPDRRALLAAIEATRAGARVPRGRFYPNLFLVGSYDWKRPDREFEDDFYDSWNVGLALDWTLFDGGARRSRGARASLEETRLRALLAMQEEGIRLEMERAYLLRRDARTALILAEEQCAAAEEFRRVVGEALGGGAATRTDLLDAETMRSAARKERVDARADLLLAEARLAYAIGGSAGGRGEKDR